MKTLKCKLRGCPLLCEETGTGFHTCIQADQPDQMGVWREPVASITKEQCTRIRAALKAKKEAAV